MGNILTTQAKKQRITRYVVITIGSMCLFVSQQIIATTFFDNPPPYNDIQPYVATQLAYDSNVLRLPNGFTPAMSGNRVDTSSFIKQLTAGLAMKWKFSQQEIIADVNVNQNWYSNYRELDYTGHNFMGQWNGQITSRLKGELSYGNSLAMGNYNQINSLILDSSGRSERNLENRENYLAGARYEITPDWYLRAQFNRSSLRYNAPTRQVSNLLETSQEYGIRYLNAQANMLGARVVITSGKYTTRSDAYVLTSGLDNAYTRTNYGLEGVWYYSIKTRFRGQLGYTVQDYKHLPIHNFSNIVWRGDILWQATSKTSLFLETWRDVYTADSLISSFVLVNGIALTPRWTWSTTPKVQVELPMSYQQQAAASNTGLSNNSAALSQSSLSRIRLNVNYMPITNIEIIAYAAYESRHSNNPLHSYTDEMVGITMKVGF